MYTMGKIVGRVSVMSDGKAYKGIHDASFSFSCL